MNYTISIVSIIVILILGLIIKENTLSHSVKIILCIMVALVTYFGLNRCITEGFAQKKGKGKGKGKGNKTRSLGDDTIPQVPIGTIWLWAGEVIPLGWQLCNGIGKVNILNDAEYNIPNLQNRFVLGAGDISDNTVRNIHSKGGNENIYLLQNNIPEHNHNINISRRGDYTKARTNLNGDGNAYDDGGGAINTSSCIECGKTWYQYSEDNTSKIKYIETQDKMSTTEKTTIKNTGNPVNIMPPYHVLKYIIKIQHVAGSI